MSFSSFAQNSDLVDLKIPFKKTYKVNIQATSLASKILNHKSSFYIKEKDSVQLFVFSMNKPQNVQVLYSQQGQSITPKISAPVNSLNLIALDAALATKGVSVPHVLSSGGKYATLSTGSNANNGLSEEQQAIVSMVKELGLDKYLKSNNTPATKQAMSTSGNMGTSATSTPTDQQTVYAGFVTVPFETVAEGKTVVNFDGQSQYAKTSAKDSVNVGKAPMVVTYKKFQENILMSQMDTISYAVDITGFPKQKVSLTLSNLSNGATAYRKVGEVLTPIMINTPIAIDNNLFDRIYFSSTASGTINYSLKFSNDQGQEKIISDKFNVLKSDLLVTADFLANNVNFVATSDKQTGKDVCYPYNEAPYNLSYLSLNNALNQSFKIRSIEFLNNSNHNDYVRFGGVGDGTKKYYNNNTTVNLADDIRLPSLLYFYTENVGDQRIRIKITNQDGTEQIIDKTLTSVRSQFSVSLVEANNKTEFTLGGYNPVFNVVINDPNPKSTFVVTPLTDKSANPLLPFAATSQNSSFDYKPTALITNDGVHHLTASILRNDNITFTGTTQIQANFLGWNIASIQAPDAINNVITLYSGATTKIRVKLTQGQNTTYNYQVAWRASWINISDVIFSISGNTIANGDASEYGGLTYTSLSNARKIDNDTYEFDLTATNNSNNTKQATFNLWMRSRFENPTNFGSERTTLGNSNLSLPTIIVNPVPVELGVTYFNNANANFINENIGLNCFVRDFNEGSNYEMMFEQLAPNSGTPCNGNITGKTFGTWFDVPKGTTTFNYVGTSIGFANIKVSLRVKGKPEFIKTQTVGIEIKEDAFQVSISDLTVFTGSSQHNQQRQKLGINITGGHSNLYDYKVFSGDTGIPMRDFSGSYGNVPTTFDNMLPIGKTPGTYCIRVYVTNNHGYTAASNLLYYTVRTAVAPSIAWIRSEGGETTPGTSSRNYSENTIEEQDASTCQYVCWQDGDGCSSGSGAQTYCPINNIRKTRKQYMYPLFRGLKDIYTINMNDATSIDLSDGTKDLKTSFSNYSFSVPEFEYQNTVITINMKINPMCYGSPETVISSNTITTLSTSRQNSTLNITTAKYE